MSAHASTTQHANAYLRTKVLTASQEELRLMLLDGAIKFARQGAEGLAKKDFEGMYNGVSQCRNIVFELLTTVRDDLDAELARNVKALYTFLYTELLDASMEKSQDKLSSVIELLEYERETWVLLMQRLSQEKGAGGQAPGEAPPSRPTLSLQG
jgi:flagellar protein FliS